MNAPHRFRRRCILTASIGALLAASSARAADVTWTNGAGNLLWNTSSLNWSTGAWNNARLDGAIFGPVGVGAVNVAAPITLRSVNFTAGGYTLSGGNALTFSRAGTSTLGARTISVATGTVTIDAPLVSTVGLEIRGAGTLTLGGSANSFTGTVPVGNLGSTVNLQIGSATSTAGGGNLTLASAAALPASTVVGIGSGVLDIGATNPTIAGLLFANTRASGASTGQVVGATGTLTVAGEIQVVGNGTGFGNQIAAKVNLAAGTQIVRVGSGSNSANELIFGNVISGSGGLTKTFFVDTNGLTSVGGFTLLGNNTYTGPTIISGNPSNLVAGSNASTGLTVGSATLTLLGASGAFASAATVSLTPGGSLVLDNVSGLSAANGLTSAVAAGNLSNRLSSTAALSLLGGTFRIAGAESAASDQQVASVALNGGFNALTLNPGAGGTSLFSTTGNLTLASGATVLFRASTLPLTTATTQGTTAFTIAGTRPAPVGAAGIIVGAIGDTSVNGNGSGFVRYNATGNAGIALLAPAEYTPNFTTAGANVDVTAAQTVGAPITVNAIRTGAFTTTLNAPVTVTTGMILATGAGTFSGASALDFGGNRGFLLGGGALTVDVPLTGSAGLTKGSVNTVTISGSTAGLSGGIVVQSGTLIFSTNTAATAFAGPLEILQGTVNFQVADSGTGAVQLGSTAAPAESAVAAGRLFLNNAAVTTFARPINVLGNGGAGFFGLTINVSNVANTQTLSGAISLGNILTISGGAAGSVLNVDGAITNPIPGSSGLFVTYNLGTVNITSPGSNYGGDLFLSGNGTVNLAGSANAGGGGVTQLGGTLRVAAPGNLGTGAIKLRGGTLQLDAAMTLNRTFSIGTNHTVATGVNDVVFSGAFHGAQGTVTKTGGGTLSLTGAGDFAGNFTLGSGGGALLINSGGRLPNLGTVTLGTGAFFQVDNSGPNLSGRTGATTNLAFDSAGVTGGATAQLTTNAAADTFTLGTISLTGGTAPNPHTSTLQITDGNAGNHTLTFQGLTPIPANNTLAVTGTANLGKTTAGGSRIFFTTPPTPGPNGSIPNLTFTGFGGSGLAAEYDPALGLIAFTTTSGFLIDNLFGVTPLTANFVTTGAALARTGATVRSLTLGGSSLMFSADYPAQSGNGNAPDDTLVLTSGRLLATTSSSVGLGSPPTKLRFGSTGTAPALIDVSSGATLTLEVTVAPTTTGGLTKTGPGTLVLAGASQITGAVDISAGTLSVSGGAAISDASAVSLVNGATLNVGGDETIGSLAGTGGSVVLNGALVVGDSTSTSFGGVISGPSFLQKVGAGTLTLTSANTFVGGTTVSGGTLALTGAGSLADTSTTIDPGATLTSDGASFTAAPRVRSDGTFTLTGAETIGVLIGTGTVNLTGATLTTGNASNNTFAGTIQGTGGLTVQGTGEVKLTGNISHTGTTTVNSGTLSVETFGQTRTIGSLVVNGGTLKLDNAAVTAGSLTGSGTVSLTAANGASQLTVGGNNADTTFAGSITGTGGTNFVKAGTGTLTLTGSSQQSAVMVLGGTLAVTGSGTLGANALFVVDGTLTTDSDALAANTEVVVQDTSTFTTSGTDSYTALSQTGGTIGGSGIQTLSGAFIQSGGTTSGSVDINSVGFTQSGGATIGAGTTVSSGGLQTLLGGTIAGTLDGGGFVTISTGATTLTGAGSINNAAVNVANGATLAIRPGVNGANNSILGQLTLGATSTLTMADGAASRLNGTSITLAGGASTLVFEVGGTATAAADNILAIAPVDIAAAGGKITIEGFGTVANPAGTYDLITGAGGSSLTTNPLRLANTRLVIAGKAYPLTLPTTATTVKLTVGAAAGADQAFWKGDVNGDWTTNNAGNTNWATDASGRTDLGSLPDILTDVIFSARGAGNLVTTGGGGTVNSISFTSGSGAVSISGAGIRLLGAGANNLGLNVTGGTASRTVNNGLGLDIDQTWLNDGAFGVTTLTLSGGVFKISAARQLTIGGRGNTLLSGNIAAASLSSLVKTGPGTLTLSGSNDLGGLLNLTGGVVSITAPTNLGATSSFVALNAGSTLRLAAGMTLGANRTISVGGLVSNPGGLDLSAGITGTLTNVSALVGGGALRLSTTGGTAASTLSVEADQQSFAGTVVVGAPGQLVGDTLSPRTFSAASGLILRLQNAGKLANVTSVTVNNGSALQITQGTTAVTNRIAAPLTFNNGRFQYDPAGSGPVNDTFGAVNATGVLTLTGGATAGPASGTNLSFGTLVRTGNATVALQSNPVFGLGSIGGGANAGVNYFFAGLADSGGTAGTPSRGIVPWAAAATVALFPNDFSTLVTYDGNGFRPLATSEMNGVTNQTQFDAAGATQNVDFAASGLPINLTINLAKTINSLIALNGVPTFTGTGTLTLASGAIANLNTVTFNGPGLNLPASGGYFHLGFPVNIQGASTIAGSNGVVASALGADSNYQLRLTNTTANLFTGGLFINGNAQVTFTANNQLGQIAFGVNAGAITLGGGQLLYAGASSVTLTDGGTARPITVNAAGGTIGATENFGTLFIPGTISGAGQVQFGGGTQSNANGTVNLSNPAANTYTGGTLISTGNLRISNPNQLGTGPILLNGGTLSAAAALNFATPLTVVQDSTLALSTNNVTLSGGISGSAGASGTAATSLVFHATGNGLFAIDGDSTFAGTLDLRTGRALLRGTLSALSAITTDSTLQLGISDGISDSAALTLTGGVLETQGFSDTVGTLTIGSSFFGTSIDLGTGASVLRFAASQAQPWTGTLSITNWSGSPAGGGTDQLFFGTDTTGLTAAILATGEIVAVPEPGSAALLLAGLTALGVRRRRATSAR